MKTQKPLRGARHGSPRNGFALIVVSLLISLLVILSLGMLTISAVEIRQSRVGNDMARAKANARMGIMLALNELQKELGPDQRITAPGSQKIPVGNASPGSHWVGVYDAWPKDPDVELRPAPNFRRWLVSGIDSTLRNEAAATNGNTGAQEEVVLVKEAPSGPGADPAIPAIKGGLIAADQGSTAWWIADQNMKAKLSGPRKIPADYQEAVAALQASPHVNLNALIDPESYPNGQAIDETDTTLRNLVSANSATLVAANHGVDREDFNYGRLFHDATSNARGLQVNVRNGNLKKDLSFMLEKPWSQVKTDAAYGPLYTSNSGSTTPPAGGGPAGISLRELWIYYNIWGEIQRGGLPNHPDGSTMTSGTPFLQSPTSPSAAKSDPFAFYKSVTLLEFRFLMSIASKLVAATPATPTEPAKPERWELQLIGDPITKIWNPYNVSYLVSSGPGIVGFEPHAITYDLVVKLRKADGTERGPVRVYFAGITGNQIISVRLSNSGQPVVMRPGDVQIYSKGLNPIIEDKASHYDAVYGYNFLSGFVYDVNLKKKDAASLNVQGEDFVEFGLAPNPAKTINSQGIGYIYQLVGKGGPGNPTRASISKAGLDAKVGHGPEAGIRATDVDHIIPTIDPDGSNEVKVSEVEIKGNTLTSKHPFAMLSYNFRTEMDDEFHPSQSWLSTRYTGKPFLGMNPKLQTFDTFGSGKEFLRSMPFQVSVKSHTTQNDTIQEIGNGQGFVGTVSSGSTNAITHALPFSPIVSMGAFQNSMANGITKIDVPSSDDLVQNYLRPTISHAIGNSFAPSIIPSGQLRRNLGPLDVVDHSYLVNLGLWDNYFISSISPTSTPAYKNQSSANTEQRQVFEEFIDKANPRPLPNARMVPIGDSQQALNELFPGFAGGAGTAPEDLAAKYLMVDGAFNVNSTSVRAWQALLKGLKGATMATLPPQNPPAEPVMTAVNDTLIPSLMIAGGGEVTTNDLKGGANLQEQWNGFRTLEDDEIDSLAEAIVRQVRLRGPFISLADFINRRPAGGGDTSLAGALQAAIDDPVVDINDGYRSGDREMSAGEAGEYENPEAEEGAKVRGVPGFVKQGDILTSLGPVLTVRGDTFLIRAYGDSRDASGVIKAKAWCEATVQRFPEYVDGTADKPEIGHSDLSSELNKKLGRQFRVTSFRYLTRNEVQ